VTQPILGRYERIEFQKHCDDIGKYIRNAQRFPEGIGRHGLSNLPDEGESMAMIGGANLRR
jgi:hypothetical protein